MNCKIAAYEINDDDAYDLLPIKSTPRSKYALSGSSTLQFSRSKRNRVPLKLALNRSLHTILVNVNRIQIQSIESGLQYLERSHNLFQSTKSNHYVYSISAGNVSSYTQQHSQELRIVQLCTSDPARSQSLLNLQQCIKVLKRNKTNQSRLRKSLVVPYRRHIFTKLFQEFIDGTSLCTFLFYLPPVHQHKTQQKSYLDRILSLLDFSCRSKHISPYTPFSKQYQTYQKQLISSSSKPSSLPSTLTNSPETQSQKDNELQFAPDLLHDDASSHHGTVIIDDDNQTVRTQDDTVSESGSKQNDTQIIRSKHTAIPLEIHAQQSQKHHAYQAFPADEMDSSLLKNAETTTLNMKTLLNRAYNELELSRQLTENLLSHKNHTIEQLSKQVDAVKHDHEKENELLKQKVNRQQSEMVLLRQQNAENQKIMKQTNQTLQEYVKVVAQQKEQIAFEQKKCKTYTQQIDALCAEIKSMNQDTQQFKSFISKITDMLNIDLEENANLSWNDIIQRIQRQTQECKQSTQKTKSMEEVVAKMNASHNADMEIYKEQIQHSQQMIHAKNKELEALRAKNESLVSELAELASNNESKLNTINQTHEQELQELHSMLDTLSVEFNSLKSSQNSTQSNSPQNESVVECLSKQLEDEKLKAVHLQFQSIVHQQLSAKLQQTQNKLQHKFSAQREKYKAQIKVLKAQIERLTAKDAENEEKLKELQQIQETHTNAHQAQRETDEKYQEVQAENESNKQRIAELSECVATTQEELETTTNSYQSLLHETAEMQQQHKELQAEFDLISRAYREVRDEYNEFKQASTNKLNDLQQTLTETQNDLNQAQESLSVTNEKWQSAQSQNKSVIKQINHFKRAMRELKSQHIALKFQSVVHRGLYASLKQEMSKVVANSHADAQELQVTIEQQHKLIDANRKSIQFKDDKYAKLMAEYVKLKRDHKVKTTDTQKANDGVLKEHKPADKTVDNLLKSLQDDKENLQTVNKQLMQRTNVYRFQSVAHQRIAKSAKSEQDQFRSQLIELLEQHAPNDQIKQLLQYQPMKPPLHSNTNDSNNHQKVSIIASEPNTLPSFAEIETPKSAQQNVSNDNVQKAMDGILAEKENTIQQLEAEKKHLSKQMDEWKAECEKHKSELETQSTALREEVDGVLAEKESRIQQLEAEKKDLSQQVDEWKMECEQHKAIEMKLNDENNDLLQQIEELYTEIKEMRDAASETDAKYAEEKAKFLSEISALKRELSQIQAMTQKATANIVKETESMLVESVQNYEVKIKELSGKIKQIENANHTLKDMVTTLSDKKNMIAAYMKIYKTKLEQSQKAQNELNESHQQQIYDKDNYIATLKEELKFKQGILEDLKDEIIAANSDWKHKNESMTKQLLSMSKLNETVQLENNQLMDEQIASHDQRQELKITLKSVQKRCHKLSQSLFHRILISECYKHKCNELQHVVETLETQRENAQTDLTVEQLKTLQLNDEINELKKCKQDTQSNETGLMLETLEAADTIRGLLEENEVLKTEMIANETKKRVSCNDPNHEEKISSLQRKFSLMCLNIEKVQLESVEFVQKAMSLREDNAKLKKHNRRITREMSKLQQELEELRARTQSQSPFSFSSMPSIVSPTNQSGISCDAEGAVNVQQLKAAMEDQIEIVVAAQDKVLHSTKDTVHAMMQRINECVDKMQAVQSCHRFNQQHTEENVKAIMFSMVGLSENVSNELQQRFDGMVSLFAMRCDNAARKLRLIKHVLTNKQNELSQSTLEQRNKMEEQLYRLQYTVKVLKDTFKKQLMSNIQHVLKSYREEYEQHQCTISKAFILTTEKYTDALRKKCDQIEQLEMVLCENKDQFELGASDYSNLKAINVGLQREVSKQQEIMNALRAELESLKIETNERELQWKKQCEEHQAAKSELETQNNALRKEVDTLEHMTESHKLQTTGLESKLSEQQETVNALRVELATLKTEMNKQELDLKKRCDEYKTATSELETQNAVLRNEVHKLEQMTESHKLQTTAKECKLDGLHKERSELMLKIKDLQHEISELQSKLTISQSDKQMSATKLQQQQQEIESLVQELKQTRKQCEECKTAKNELKTQNAVLRKEVDKLEQTVESHQLQTTEKESKLDGLHKERSVLMIEIKDLQHEISKVQSKLTAVQSDKQMSATKQQREIESLAKELKQTQKQCEEYKMAKSELATQNNALIKEVDKLEQMTESHKLQTTAKECKLDGLHKERSELMVKIKDLQHEISELQSKLTVSQSDKQITVTKQQQQEQEIDSLSQELKQTQKQRDKYYQDKQLLQQEMKLVNKQLDELNATKTQLMSQIEQMMEFQNNTAQLREKMEQYVQMTACNQQRIQQLESMKSTLEKDNVKQLDQMQKVCTENEQLREQTKAQKKSIYEMEQTMHEQEVRIAELMESVSALQDERDTVMIESISNATSNKEHDDTISKLQQIINEHRHKLLNAENVSEDTKKELMRLRANEIELRAENMLLRDEMVSVDGQIDKLKQCILQKFDSLKQEFNDKVHELATTQSAIQYLETKKCELQSAIQLYKIELIEKDQVIKDLQGQIAEIQAEYDEEKALIHHKLTTLEVVIQNKLVSCADIIRGKDVEIQELCDELTKRDEEMFDLKKSRSDAVMRMNGELMNKLQVLEENDMLKNIKVRFEHEIEELNTQLTASHNKHRVVKQSYEETNKMNKKLQSTIGEFRKQIANIQQQIAFMKHENEQIYRHRDHIKERCQELESRVTRYKEKFKSVAKECSLLRKKANVFDQLLRLADNEIQQLQFDKKASHVREKMLSDLIEKANGDGMHALYQSYQAICNQIQHIYQHFHHENEENNNHKALVLYDHAQTDEMEKRVNDLKSECDHYKQIIALLDQNSMDLKQQTALYVHQILENWQKIFDKLTSMINIKSYTIEILHKTVNDIIEINNHRNATDFEKENQLLTHNIEEMQENIRKLETRHRKEKTELQGLLDREMQLAQNQRDMMQKEVAVYREKLQSFYKKYRRKQEQKEQEQLEVFIDNMRHEMSQITQENVTMATVTNSLKEIVREHQDKTYKLETQNEAMYKDIYELCQYMQQISGETFLSEDEGNMYNPGNVAQMVSMVKQRALSISSSRSSLQHENDTQEHEEEEDIEANPSSARHSYSERVQDPTDNDEEEYDIIDAETASDHRGQCPICEQEFNTMVWKYECTKCGHLHCSICAPMRVTNDSDNKKCRICHTCYHSHSH